MKPETQNQKIDKDFGIRLLFTILRLGLSEIVTIFVIFGSLMWWGRAFYFLEWFNFEFNISWGGVEALPMALLILHSIIAPIIYSLITMRFKWGIIVSSPVYILFIFSATDLNSIKILLLNLVSLFVSFVSLYILSKNFRAYINPKIRKYATYINRRSEGF